MSLLALTLAGAGAAGLYAAGVEPRLLRLRRPEIAAAGWPAGASPLRIGVLSDLHAAWPHMTIARVERIVARLLAARPDLVLLPGDFVTTHTYLVRHIPIEPVAQALAALARAAPTLAVLGNHDWHYGGERIATALELAGIRVLQNAAARVETARGPLWVAGLDDLWTGRADLGRTLRDLDRSAPAVMLSHMPDVFPHLPPEVALTVAGHTHGGQVCLPGLGPLRTLTSLPRRLAYGLHEIDGRHLYVSGGVGTTALPIRFWRPPEIALLTMAASG
jgi:predicted MPP superfamily phosphohydrolase